MGLSVRPRARNRLPLIEFYEMFGGRGGGITKFVQKIQVCLTQVKFVAWIVTLMATPVTDVTFDLNEIIDIYFVLHALYTIHKNEQRKSAKRNV